MRLNSGEQGLTDAGDKRAAREGEGGGVIGKSAQRERGVTGRR